MRLTVVSDPICPWCWIGKARLDAALAARPGALAPEWRAFMLNPDMPAGGMPRDAYARAKFGARRAEIEGAIEAAAEDAGLPIDLSRLTRTPSTVNAHRALRLARIEARDHALSGALFEAYFVRGGDIEDPDALADLAAGVGMDGDAVAATLRGDDGRDAVIAEADHARRCGVDGVPTYFVGGGAISGARPAEAWIAVIDALTARAQEA